MENKYLFRGKAKETGEWLMGGICERDGRYFIIETTIYEIDNSKSWGMFEVDPETVGQFTGLEDKDNVKIFDGDLLLFGDEALIVYWNSEVYGWQAKKQNVADPFKRFPCKDWDYIDFGWIAAEVPCTGTMTTQVGGNIYDNPEVYDNTDDYAWEDFVFLNTEV